MILDLDKLLDRITFLDGQIRTIDARIQDLQAKESEMRALIREPGNYDPGKLQEALEGIGTDLQSYRQVRTELEGKKQAVFDQIRQAREILRAHGRTD